MISKLKSSINLIFRNNFSVDHEPVLQGDTVRTKKMMFGRGVYFSELPAVSLMYGDGLLLCKVLLGACQEYRPRAGAEQAPIPAH